MDDYTKQLERTIEELQNKLAAYEQVADLRKFSDMRHGIADAVLTNIDTRAEVNTQIKTVHFGNAKYKFNGRKDVRVHVNMTFECNDDGSKILEFIKELTNCMNHT